MAKDTVLVIEDDKSISDKVCERLKAEGFKVRQALDGEEGWSQIQNEHPDIIILDIMLPKLDGLSLCRMVRHEAKTSHIPIIMLTARGTEIDKIVALESGADDYVVNPFSMGEFLARVRAIVRRSGGHQKPLGELISDNLRLAVIERRAFYNDSEIKLSNKEFELLVELMRNTNIVLSRDLLLTKVWGHDYYIDKRTVDVHIRWLREKIEEDPSNPKRIITVRGVGYRFEG